MEWFRCGSVLSGLIEHVGDTVIPRSFFEKLGNAFEIESNEWRELGGPFLTRCKKRVRKKAAGPFLGCNA